MKSQPVHAWHLLLLLPLVLLLSTLQYANAIPERDPMMVRAAGYVIVDPQLIKQYCPLCTDGKICCYTAIPARNAYSCTTNYTRNSTNLFVDGDMCVAEGRFCRAALGDGQRLSCLQTYLTQYPCTVTDRRTTNCQYEKPMRGIPPKCLGGLISCNSVAKDQEYPMYAAIAFCVYQAIMFFLLVLRFRSQPLKARSSFITLVSLILSSLIGITYGFAYTMMPCFLLYILLLIGYPLVGVSSIVRSLYLFGVWHQSVLKPKLLKLIKMKNNSYFDDPVSAEEIQLRSGSRKSSFAAITPETDVSASLPPIEGVSDILDPKLNKGETLEQLQRKMKVLNFLASSVPLTIVTYGIIFFLCIVVYAVYLGTHSNNDWNGVLFILGTHACNLDDFAIAYCLFVYGVYVLAFVFFLILNRTVRDGYSIWWINILDYISSFLFMGIGIVLEAFKVFSAGGLSFALLLLAWLAISEFIQVVIPVILSFFWKSSMKRLKKATGAEPTTPAQQELLEGSLPSRGRSDSNASTGGSPVGTPVISLTRKNSNSMMEISTPTGGATAGSSSPTALVSTPTVSSPVGQKISAKKIPKPSLDNVKDIQVFLQNEKLRPFFVEFCKKEFSTENPLCHADIIRYAKITNIEKRRVLAKEMIETYIVNGSPLELNINKKIRGEVEESFKKNDATITLFQRIQEETEFIMNDTFCRFMTGAEFKTLSKDIEKRKKYYTAGFTNKFSPPVY